MHTMDGQCRVNLDTMTCYECGASHAGMPCQYCRGVAYHSSQCPTLEAAAGKNIEQIVNEGITRRAELEWSKLAQEPVTVEKISGVLCAFGSELACYRIHYKMRKGRVARSKSRQSWYYCEE